MQKTITGVKPLFKKDKHNPDFFYRKKGIIQCFIVKGFHMEEYRFLPDHE